MNINLIINSLPLLLKGAGLSLLIACCAIFLGLLGGTVLALFQTYGPRILKKAIYAYVSLIRGTPLIIQLVFFDSILPKLGIFLPGAVIAILALGMNSSAYVSQIIYGGIASVPRDQTEAAFVLGFSMPQTAYYIVLPQAFRNIFPSLTNEMITLVKDSSLASLIGVGELYKQGQSIINYTYDIVSIFFIIAALYLIMTSFIASLSHFIARRYNIHA